MMCWQLVSAMLAARLTGLHTCSAAMCCSWQCQTWPRELPGSTCPHHATAIQSPHAWPHMACRLPAPQIFSVGDVADRMAVILTGTVEVWTHPPGEASAKELGCPATGCLMQSCSSRLGPSAAEAAIHTCCLCVCAAGGPYRGTQERSLSHDAC
jgi:hypothetical protein